MQVKFEDTKLTSQEHFSREQTHILQLVLRQ